jgi:hypothetical protein
MLTLPGFNSLYINHALNALYVFDHLVQVFHVLDIKRKIERSSLVLVRYCFSMGYICLQRADR